ncbi:MAG TPA: methyltransferase domain-containing protein [Gammaproteobacteria bacterium]
MSSTFGINYSTRIVSYDVGATAAPADRAEREQAAVVDLTSALLEATYALTGELRGLGAVAHGLLRERQMVPARERVLAALDAVRALQADLAAVRGAALVPQLEALGLHEGSRELKVHIGCGGHELPGWINVDNHPAPLAINLDWGLPLPTGSARYLFVAHLLEHLFHPAQSSRLLAEIRRVLAPGGVVRIVVPDIEKYLRAYANGDEAFFAEHRRQRGLPVELTHLETLLPYAGAGATPDALFEHHKFGYDFATLARAVERAGFVDVRRCDYQQSPHAQLRVDDASSNATAQHDGQHYSLFVEARA